MVCRLYLALACCWALASALDLRVDSQSGRSTLPCGTDVPCRTVSLALQQALPGQQTIISVFRGDYSSEGTVQLIGCSIRIFNANLTSGRVRLFLRDPFV